MFVAHTDYRRGYTLMGVVGDNCVSSSCLYLRRAPQIMFQVGDFFILFYWYVRPEGPKAYN